MKNGPELTQAIITAVGPIIGGMPADLVIEAFAAAMMGLLEIGCTTGEDRRIILHRYATAIKQHADHGRPFSAFQEAARNGGMGKMSADEIVPVGSQAVKEPDSEPEPKRGIQNEKRWKREYAKTQLRWRGDDVEHAVLEQLWEIHHCKDLVVEQITEEWRPVPCVE